MQCPSCQSDAQKFQNTQWGQRYRCPVCKKTFTDRSTRNEPVQAKAEIKIAPEPAPPPEPQVPYPGPLPRLPLENNILHCCRWVATRQPHREEPWELKQYRDMQAQSPVKFLELYSKERSQWEKEAKDAGEQKQVKESTEPCDVLVRRLLTKWGKIDALRKAMASNGVV